ncbi:MAG: helix-turn-helix transcriptional regulator, partial [Dehalococcoidia bacterium]
RWYLVAWDTDRRDWRSFRVDRMEPRPPTGPRFTPRDSSDQDAAAYVSWTISSGERRYRARFTLHAPIEIVADRVPPTSGLLEPLDAHTCTLYTGSNSLNALALHVALIGVDFEVHEPPELVEHIRMLAARLGQAMSAQPSPE